MIRSRLGRHIIAFVMTLCCLGALTQTAHAQGSFEPAYVIRTGTAPGPLITVSQNVFLPASGLEQMLYLAFGFSTSEAIAPQTFLDSVTLTLKDETAGTAAIFATIDRTGTYWAPTPGGLPVDPAAIIRHPISFPNLSPAYANQWAYLVGLPVPAAWSGKNLTLYLDLFDNQNDSGSLGWMSEGSLVPEPAAFSLLGVGFAVWTLCRRRPCRG